MSKRKKRTYRKDVTVGPNQRKTVRASSKKELDEKVEALKRQVASGLIVGTGKEAVDKVANEWLEFHAIDRELEQSTILGYRNTIKAHITPLFGSYSIEQLTEQIIVSLIGHRQSSSPSTRRKILLVLRLTLTFAKRRGMIAHDPMEFMRLPGQKNVSDKAMTCMSLDQAKTFLRACEGVRFGRFFKILALTGMREGELLAARPQDFTKDYAAIWIRRTMSDNLEGEAIEKDAPKTKSSRRKLPLPALARDAVIEEVEARMKEGRTHHNTLFSTSAGTPPQRQNLMRRQFRPMLKKAGLPIEMTIHDLRHTYATCALNAGIGVHLVSKMLGHASVKITLDLYSHALPEATEDAVQVVDRMFGKRA
ncbi:MAG: site-specific integrase [Planctomycetaceae bacterium]|nr:site-specific integrase [Planctomycetaceae bacterium]